MAFTRPNPTRKRLLSAAATPEASPFTPTAAPTWYFDELQEPPDEVHLPWLLELDDESSQTPHWATLSPELAAIGMDEVGAYRDSATPDWYSNLAFGAATPISSSPSQPPTPCATDIESGQSTPSSLTEDVKPDSPYGVTVTRAQAIELFKDIIKDLYMVQNLALPEVKKIMADEHDFRETDKVYKNAFSRWRFNKYKSRRQQEHPMASGQPLSGKGRRILNSGAPRITRRLLHAGPNARYIDAISRAAADFLQGTLCPDNGQVRSRDTRLGGISTGIGSLGFLMITAKRAFRDGSVTLAGGLLREAFLKIEPSILRLDCRSFMELCFRVPNILLESSRYDWAAAFTSHARDMALALNLGSYHPVTVIMAAAYSLLQDSDASGEALRAVMAQCSAGAAKRISALHGGVLAEDLSTWCRFNVTPTQAEMQHLLDQLGALEYHTNNWLLLHGWDDFLSLQEQSEVYIEQYPELAMRDMRRLLGVIRGTACDCWEISRFISRCAGLVRFCRTRRHTLPDFDEMLEQVVERLWDMRPTAFWDFADMVEGLGFIGRQDIAGRFHQRRRDFLIAEGRHSLLERARRMSLVGQSPEYSWSE